MAKGGRKSAAEIGLVVTLPGQRPEPPTDLTAPQAAIWRAVVSTKPADWFGADTQPLLRSYCRHTASAETLAKHIAKLEDADDLDIGLYADLLKARDRETRAMAALARSMRLTQQSRYTPQAAGTKAGSVGAAARKPWEAEA